MDVTVVAALAVLAILLWLTEAVPPAVVALLIAVGAVASGVATRADAFAAFGNPILFLFVGAFMIGEAMHVHGLGARMARFATSGARGPLGTIAAISGAAWMISTCMSNAAATAIVLPAAIAVARSIDDKKLRAAIALSVSLGASTGGLATPIGTAPNAIGLRALAAHDAEVSFGAWMSLGFPLALCLLFLSWLVLTVVVHPAADAVPAVVRQAHVPWSRGEVAAAVAGVLAVAGWLAPAVVGSFDLALGKSLHARMPEEIVALGVAVLLFCWPIGGGRRALAWQDAARIEWGTILLFGGGLLLGDLVERAGLSALIGATVVEHTGAASTAAVVAIVAVAGLLLSELASNTAAATLIVPIALAVAGAAGVDPVKPVLAATLASSLGFMMPISTPPNAMVYATGFVPLRTMLKVGLVFDAVALVAVIGAVLLW